MMYKRENKRYVNKQHNTEIILCSPAVHGIYEIIIHKNINNMGLSFNENHCMEIFVKHLKLVVFS